MKTYDFALTWTPQESRCYFTDLLMSDCKEKGLSFLWVSDTNARSVIRQLERGELKINVLLDTEATYDIPGDLYSRVCYGVKDAGGVVINDPDRTQFAVDKSVMYYELLDAGIDTPYTVVVRNWEPKKIKLAENERKKLGVPFIIKPGCGWGHRGVVYDAKGSIREIAEARNYNWGDNFLLQERIEPLTLSGKYAWFRVFHIFDKIIPCWWHDRTSRYDHVTLEEFKKYKLTPLVRFTTRIGNISNMVWFSTEIAIDEKDGKRRFTAIDYVNDQCDMEAQSEDKNGVPDHIVKFTAYSIIHASQQLISGQKEKRKKKYTVLLAEDNHMGMKGLGYAPELLTQKI